jgi:hypothetical protein
MLQLRFHQLPTRNYNTTNGSARILILRGDSSMIIGLDVHQISATRGV